MKREDLRKILWPSSSAAYFNISKTSQLYINFEKALDALMGEIEKEKQSFPQTEQELVFTFNNKGEQIGIIVPKYGWLSTVCPGISDAKKQTLRIKESNVRGSLMDELERVAVAHAEIESKINEPEFTKRNEL